MDDVLIDDSVLTDLRLYYSGKVVVGLDDRLSTMQKTRTILQDIKSKYKVDHFKRKLVDEKKRNPNIVFQSTKKQYSSQIANHIASDVSRYHQLISERKENLDFVMNKHLLAIKNNIKYP